MSNQPRVLPSPGELQGAVDLQARKLAQEQAQREQAHVALQSMARDIQVMKHQGLVDGDWVVGQDFGLYCPVFVAGAHQDKPSMVRLAYVGGPNERGGREPLHWELSLVTSPNSWELLANAPTLEVLDAAHLLSVLRFFEQWVATHFGALDPRTPGARVSAPRRIK